MIMIIFNLCVLHCDIIFTISSRTCLPSNIIKIKYICISIYEINIMNDFVVGLLGLACVQRILIMQVKPVKWKEHFFLEF